MKTTTCMTIVIGAVMASCSAIAMADRNNDGARKSNSSYGAPTLYYSYESIQQRRELELLEKSNELAEKRFELEERQLRDESRRELPYHDQDNE